MCCSHFVWHPGVVQHPPTVAGEGATPTLHGAWMSCGAHPPCGVAGEGTASTWVSCGIHPPCDVTGEGSTSTGVLCGIHPLFDVAGQGTASTQVLCSVHPPFDVAGLGTTSTLCSSWVSCMLRIHVSVQILILLIFYSSQFILLI